MQVGDLVTMGKVAGYSAEGIRELFGIGLIVRTDHHGRCFVRWSSTPDTEPRAHDPFILEIINESR